MRVSGLDNHVSVNTSVRYLTDDVLVGETDDQSGRSRGRERKKGREGGKKGREGGKVEREGGKERREGRKKGRKERRKERRKNGRKEGG